MPKSKSEHAKEQYQEKRAEILAARKRRYQQDKEFRERAKKRYRERYHQDSAYAALTLERAKKRYRRLKQAQKSKGEA